LEDQLLKLKEQREALKQQGQKHEDSIMKENAKLQKEVKYRITYMKDYMEKIEKGLAEDAQREKERKEVERERLWREQEKAREELERTEMIKKEKGRDSSRDSSEDKERKKKKKKKEKSRDRSSSNSSAESERKKKKKKKKNKNRDRSSESTGSSDSEGEKKRKKASKAASMDEDLFKMVAEVKSRKKKTGSGEDVLVDLMGKMSESYSKVKNENEELSARCVVLENQNKGLKKQVEDLQDQLDRRDRDRERDRDGDRDSRRSERSSRREGRDREDRGRYKSGSDPYKQDREHYKGEKEDTTQPPAPPSYLVKPPAPVPPAIPKNPHNPNLEPLGPRKGSWARGAGAGTGLEVALQQQIPGYGPPVGVPPPQQMVPPPMMVPKPDNVEDEKDRYRRDDRREYGRDDRREYGRDDRRRDRERSRSRSRSSRFSRRERSRSREKERDTKSRDRTVRDKNDKIDLKEWAQPPEHQMDPSLMSLKEKMKAKEEGFRREEELRNRWVTSEPEPTPPPEPLKPHEQPIPENRPSVAISWGQGIKKTPEPQLPPKKNNPMVGKMPWLKRGDSNGPEQPPVNGRERRSKFGPPVSSNSIPPPSLVTQVPTLGQQQGQMGGPTQDMIEQGYSQGYPQPPPPMAGPPPSMTQNNANMEQQYGGHDQQAQMMMMAGYGYGVPPPQQEVTPPPEPTPAPPPKPQRNPKPQSMDMNAMIAAAQQHMQKNLTSKLLSIGVPIGRFGIPSSGQTETESIPLPGDPMGVDMDIADIPAPPMPDIPRQNQPAPDIPLPPEIQADTEPDNQPPGESFEDDCAPPGEEIAPPGEGPDEDEMRMLGIDPGDAVVG